MPPLQKLSLILALGTGVGLLPNDASAIQQDKLSEIRALVSDNNVTALMSFISKNPQVLDETPLGKSLTDFAKDPPNVVERFFGVGVPRELSDVAAQSKNDSSIY